MDRRQSISIFIDYLPRTLSNRRTFKQETQSNFEILKRSLDIFFSLAFLVTVGWFVLIIIALLIALSSKGPVIFRQWRNGYRGQRFVCYKFRTMYFNENDEFEQAKENDDRVTYIGKFLRKTSLDELPQIFNVLKGDMSLVGPRPHPIPLDDQYAEKWNTYLSRYQSKPGLTGLAQIKGFRGITETESDMKGRLRFDLLYVKRRNIFLDLSIILKSFILVFRGDPNAF